MSSSRIDLEFSFAGDVGEGSNISQHTQSDNATQMLRSSSGNTADANNDPNNDNNPENSGNEGTEIRLPAFTDVFGDICLYAERYLQTPTSSSGVEGPDVELQG